MSKKAPVNHGRRRRWRGRSVPKGLNMSCVMDRPKGTGNDKEREKKRERKNRDTRTERNWNSEKVVVEREKCH